MSALEKAAGQGKDSYRGPQAATEVGEERSQFRGTRERIGTLAAFVVDVRFEQIPGIRPGPLSLFRQELEPGEKPSWSDWPQQ